METVDKKNKPDFVSAAASAMETEIQMHYDLMTGTAGVRANADYMPKYPLESEDGWNTKRAGATFYNYYAKTVNTDVGLILRREPQIMQNGSEAFRAAFTEHWENITSDGMHGKVFLQNALEHQFAGHIFIVVDFPAKDERIKDKVDERNAKRRPFWSLYTAGQAKNGRFGVVDNKLVLTQISFKEIHTEPEGVFGEQQVIYYRVWELRPFGSEGRIIHRAVWTLWKETKNNNGEITLNPTSNAGVTKLSRLPIAIAYGSKTGNGTSRPPLADLAYTNIRHYQDYADYRKGKAIAGLALLWSRGLKDTDLAIGWDVMLKLEGAEAEVGFLEANGTALGAQRTGLEDTKQEMAELAMALLLDRAAVNKTATEAVIDHTQRSSGLLKIADSLKDAVEVAMEIHGEYLDYTKEDICSMDLGYKPEELVLSPQNVELLFKLYELGLITDEMLLRCFKGGGSLPDDFDVEEELTKARTEFKARQPEVKPESVAEIVGNGAVVTK